LSLMKDAAAENLEMDSLSTRMSKMFQVAETGLRRIGSTVELMQRYSREGYSRNLQRIDVFALARDVVVMLEAVAQRNVLTSFSGEGGMECVPDEFNQVLTNLIQNGLDATAADGTGHVEVIGVGEAEQITLRVRDNGHGITLDQRSRIFTPFYTTKEVGRGMGLGLTIVRRVVTSLGGTISIQSQPNVGTEFTLCLPRTQPLETARSESPSVRPEFEGTREAESA
jgi:two-component system NtrC family sensor kinase